ncbi:hypothetical protein BD626DRAFT_516656 [Schizophyllum amplum]|uniref:Shugoshin C-terminal domain-containing protein n=1 Tax=Schizophyllum amplum TaxID=97359 RepID=A0A550BWT2_9AGAR|nr:hypothetical protein BD626DRAFT_516656 [Auriculariopsis ampla]
MSRRESRASMNVAKQNDVLFEFENYKKKFALQNKHITKLNSTLSVKIEELTAEISTLRAENLILRASENALKAQLRQEHDKSRKVLSQAEAAIAAQFEAVRAALKIEPSPPRQPSPTFPRAQRPPPKQYSSSPTSSPLRVCRAPSVPEICEESETCASDSEIARRSPTLRKTKAKPRLSASRLPLPQRTSSPPPEATPGPSMRIDFTSLAPPKRMSTSRRQSGLLTIDTQLAREPKMERPGTPSPIDIPDDDEDALEDYDLPRRIKKKKSRTREPEVDKEQVAEAVDVGRPRDSERRKRKTAETDDLPLSSGTKFKDVTNAVQPHDQGALPRAPKIEPEEGKVEPTRAFLAAQPAETSRQRSSSPIPSDADAAGRERRVRKSVNYAEPKLNTKMRKPDPAPGAAGAVPATVHTKKRSSSSSGTSRVPSTEPEDEPEDGGERRSSLERRTSLERRSRARDAAVCVVHDPEAATDEEQQQRTIRRKKSRPQVVPPDASDDSEGGDADGEWVPTRGWVNVEGRRKSSAAGAGVTARRASRVSEDPVRRHSVAA